MSEIFFGPTSPVGCIPSPWQYDCFTVLRRIQKTESKLFLLPNKTSAECFPDLLFLSLFLLSSFSLLPSLSPLCTQECFVWSGDKRNKRHHWQKWLCPSMCVCVCVWLCESGFAITCVFLFMCVCDCRRTRVILYASMCVLVQSSEKESTITCVCVCVRDEWKGKRGSGREEEREKDLWQKALVSILRWRETLLHLSFSVFVSFSHSHTFLFLPTSVCSTVVSSFLSFTSNNFIWSVLKVPKQCGI